MCCDPLCLAEPRAHTPDGAEEVADAAAERRAASASCAAARAASSARACSPARQPALTTHVPASTAPASAPPLAPARLLLVSWRANVQTPTGQPRHGTRHAATLTAFALGAHPGAARWGCARAARRRPAARARPAPASARPPSHRCRAPRRRRPPPARDTLVCTDSIFSSFLANHSRARASPGRAQLRGAPHAGRRAAFAGGRPRVAWQEG